MRIGGIICEYNPFHNGHAYQLQQLRSRGVTHIACFMSPNVVQRGEIAITDKWQRAATAVANGADIVFELPAPYVLSAADVFAFGGVSLMKAVGCTDICFGAHSKSEELLHTLHQLQFDSMQEQIKLHMTNGLSYPAACAAALGTDLPANDMLGITYLAACGKLEYTPQLQVVERIGAEHDSDVTSGNFASASHLRSILRAGGSVAQFAPQSLHRITEQISDMEALASVILHKLRTTDAESLKVLPEVSEGLENRILRAAADAHSLQELLDNIKTKRYPMARIKRTLLCSLAGITREDTQQAPPYLRVLAMNQKGREVISHAASLGLLPVSTSLKELESLSPITARFGAIERACTDIFSCASGFSLPSHADYTVKPYI